MESKEYYISHITQYTDMLRTQYEVKSLRLFGSVARGEQHTGSDVDVAVDMAPKAYLVSGLKRFLENLLQCPVDIVRMHSHMNPYLREEIENDGIYLIK